MNVIWHREAVIEYDDILSQTQTRNLQEAKNITAHVEQALTTLQQFPQSGRFLRSRGCYEKYVPHTRIILVYLCKNEDILILSAFHSSRDPKTKAFERRNDIL
jgi:plasmid stabilization system protein ParE